MSAELDLACHLNIVVADASSHTLPAALELIAGAGFAHVVLPPLDPATADVPFLRNAFAAAGLTPITIAVQSAAADVSSTDAAIRTAGRELLERTVELTRDIGGDQMNGVPYGLFGRAVHPPSAAQVAWAADGVGRAADHAAAASILMTFEVLNRYETAMINTAAQAVDFVRMSGSENLRIHLDTFHMAIEEVDARTAVSTALPYLGYLEIGQSGRGPLGSGACDVHGLVRHAVDEGYTGRWGIEAFSRTMLSAADANMLAIWNETYTNALELIVDARRYLHRGWSESFTGRRARGARREGST